MKLKTLKWIALPILSVILWGGCADKKSKQDENGIYVVSEFPAEVTLNSKDTLGGAIDDIGISSIRIVDSLLIAHKFDTWSVYSVNGKYYGDALKRGEGPCEFAYIPFAPTVTLEKGDSAKFYLIDALKGKEIEFNLSAFVARRGADVPYLKERPLEFLSDLTWSPVKVSEDTYIFTTPAEAETKQLRMIVIGDSIAELKMPQPVSGYKISEGEDINILSRFSSYSPQSDKVVEVSIMQNLISVYSPDGKFDKTISIGEPVSVEDVEKTDYENRKDTFRNLAMWDNGFGVLSHPKKEKDEVY